MATASWLLTNELQASVSEASSFWGGLSGNVSIANISQHSKNNWSFSFISSYSSFDFWNADESAVRNSDGTYTITVRAPAGAPPLAAGARLDLGFTVMSDSDATVTLAEAVLGPVDTSTRGGSNTTISGGDASSPASTSAPTSPSRGSATAAQTVTENANETATENETETSTATASDGLMVEVQLGSSWSGAYEGTLTVRNSGSSAVAAGWSVSFISDHRLASISDFQVQQQLQANGRTLVTLSAPSWSVNQGLAAGARLSSYVQAQGDRAGRSVAELFTIASAPSGSSSGAASGFTTESRSGSTSSGTGGSAGSAGPAGTDPLSGSSTGSSTGTSPNPLSAPAGVNSGNSGDARWGEAYFAPYVDMALWPVPDLPAIAASRGTSLLTLGFLQASGSGQLGWGGLDALAISPTNSNDQAQAIRASIQAFQRAGGDVMLSLGGMNGSSLAQVGARNGMSASTLAARYAEVVSQFQLNRLDFDIEGSPSPMTRPTPCTARPWPCCNSRTPTWRSGTPCRCCPQASPPMGSLWCARPWPPA